MKKVILIMSILLSASIFGVEDDLNLAKLIVADRAGVMSYIRELKLNPRINKQGRQIFLANVISADEGLKQIGLLSEKIDIDNVFLAFPDVKYVDRYIENVSKNVGNVTIVLMEKKSNEKYFENRDYETYLANKVDKKVANLQNVKVYKVDVAKDDVEIMLLNSLTKPINQDAIMQKYIEDIYNESLK